MRIRRVGALVLTCIVAVITLPEDVLGGPEASARIQVQNQAGNGGHIVFIFAPESGVSTPITVQIYDKASASAACQLIRPALRGKLSSDDYEIETDDCTEADGIRRHYVNIKAKSGKPRFTLTTGDQTVEIQTYTVEQPIPDEAVKDKDRGVRGEFAAVTIQIVPFGLSGCTMWDAEVFDFGTGVITQSFAVQNDSTATVAIYIDSLAPPGSEGVWVLSADENVITNAGLFTVGQPESIPSLTEWGMVVLVVALAGSCIRILCRRRGKIRASV